MRDRLGDKGRGRALRWLALAAVMLALGAAVSSVATARESKSSQAARLSPKIEARIELGRRLFFEPIVSRGGGHSCASCHAPEHGFSDPDRQSLDGDGLTPRHSQTIVDSVFNTSAHWDGEFNSVEELVTRRLGDFVSIYYKGANTRPIPPPITPRDPTFDQRDENDRPFRRTFLNKLTFNLPPTVTVSSRVPDRLAAVGRYEEAFKAAFGDKRPTLENLALALAAYCYSVESTESPYDRYLEGDEKALSPSARRGLALFEGRAGCSQCHISRGEEKPLFSDFRFHNTGVAFTERLERGDPDSIQGLVRRLLEKQFKNPAELHEQLGKLHFDRGRGAFSHKTKHNRAFKTPTLRDVARRGPYFHDGHAKTLEDVVRYYAKGCGDDPTKDKRLQPFAAGDQEVTDLVAFLHALTGDERPGLARRAWRARAKRQRLQVLNPEGNPVPGVTVRIMPSGDAIPVKGKTMDEDWRGVTDGRGWVSYPVPASTHARVAFADGLQVLGSPLIPDTCRVATVKIPSRGRMSFVVVLPKDFPVPPALVMEHTSMPQTAKGFVRTTFPRVGVAENANERIARYSGWIRGDRTTLVTLKLPGLRSSRRSPAKLPAMSVSLVVGTEARLDLTGN